jgi:hypothetical protein
MKNEKKQRKKLEGEEIGEAGGRGRGDGLAGRAGGERDDV